MRYRITPQACLADPRPGTERLYAVLKSPDTGNVWETMAENMESHDAALFVALLQAVAAFVDAGRE